MTIREPDMSRTPPTAVRRELRGEVGFGCPVPECGVPYLTYHHFDPPWSVEHHHRPEGMIALCRRHADLADAGTWTDDQLRTFKSAASGTLAELFGRFEWMRHDVIALIGGNFYADTPRMVSYRDEPVIWYERDEHSHVLLNVRMLTASGEPRAELRNNDWIVVGSPTDVESPPGGRTLRVRYENGDDLMVAFWEAATLEAFRDRYKLPESDAYAELPFPLLVTEIQMTVADGGIRFGPRTTEVGQAKITGFGVFRLRDGFVIT